MSIQMEKTIKLIYENHFEGTVCRICIESLPSDEEARHDLFVNCTMDTEYGYFTLKPSNILGQILQRKILPKNNKAHLICLKCFDNLINSFLFKLQCQKSDRLWLAQIKAEEDKTVNKTFNVTINSNDENSDQKAASIDHDFNDKEHKSSYKKTGIIELEQANQQNSSGIMTNKNDVQELTLKDTLKSYNHYQNSDFDSETVNIEFKERNSISPQPTSHYKVIESTIKDTINIANYSQESNIDSKTVNSNLIERTNLSPQPIAYCTLCKKLLSTKQSVKRHFKRMHPNLLNCAKYCLFDGLEKFIREHKAMKVTQIQCSKCNSRFKNEMSLKAHMYKHSLKSPFCHLQSVSIKIENPDFCFPAEEKLPCAYCNKSYSSASSLHFHMKRNHFDVLAETADENDLGKNAGVSNSNFLCKLCNKNYFSYAAYSRHNKYLHNDYYSEFLKDEVKRKELENSNPVIFHMFNNYCQICDRLYQENLTYQRHIRSSHPELKAFHNKENTEVPKIESHNKEEETAFVKCDICSCVFFTEKEFYNHNKILTDQNCKKCSLKFLYLCDLYVHYINVHKEKLRQCNICPVSFMMDYDLIVHISLKHADGATFLCHLCNNSFASELRLRAHKCFHHRCMQCKECGKKFRLPESLEKHMEVHSKLTAYVCDICHRDFDHKEPLIQHIKNHEKNKIKEVCFVCGMLFQTQWKKLFHYRSKHPHVFTKECKFCPMKFFSARALNRHICWHLKKSGLSGQTSRDHNQKSNVPKINPMNCELEVVSQKAIQSNF